MKKILLIVTMITVLTQSAYALSFGAGAGVYVPDGDYKDMFDVGYSVGARVEQGLFIFTDLVLEYEMVSATGKGAYSGYDLQGNNIDLMLKVAPIPIIINPYIAAGGSYTSNSFSGDSKFTQDGFGFVAEVGLGFNILIVDLGLKVKYRNVSLSSSNNISGKQANSITGGVYATVKIPFI